MFAVSAISGGGTRALVYAIQDWLEANPAGPEDAAAPGDIVDKSTNVAVLTPAPVARRRRRPVDDAGGAE